MKKFSPTTVTFTAAIFVVAAVNFSQPSIAVAGVLTRGSTTKGLSIGKPKAHDRSVRKTTAVMRSTGPSLEFRGSSPVDTYVQLQRANIKFQQKYFRWEKKKYQLEQRAYREEMQKKQELERDQSKKKQVLARLFKSHGSTSSSTASTPDDSGVSFDPRAWFSKKIAHHEEGGLLSFNKSKGESSDSPGKELKVQSAPKKIGFWGHLKRAIFGI